jgi:hypothetical protein
LSEGTRRGVLEYAENLDRDVDRLIAQIAANSGGAPRSKAEFAIDVV